MDDKRNVSFFFVCCENDGETLTSVTRTKVQNKSYYPRTKTFSNPISKMDPTSDPNNPNLLPSQIFTTVAALLPAIDRRIIVVLRDGRKFFGVLRSFDQFGM